MKKAAPAYGEVFSPENAGGENLDLLRQQGDANSLANILSQNFELKTRGPSAAGLPSRLPDAKLIRRTQMVGGCVGRDASGLRQHPRIARPDRRDDECHPRRRTTGGAAPIPVSSDQLSVPLSIGGAAATGQLWPLAGLAPKAVTYAASKYYGKKLLDPAFTTSLVQGGNGPMLTPLDLARVMASSVGAQQQPQ